MKDYKMLDLFYASNEEAGKVVLEEIFPAIVKEYGGCVVGEGVASLVGDMIGAICPRINSIYLSYKQKRLETNVMNALEQLKNRQDEIENQLLLYKCDEDANIYLQKISQMMLDNIIDEIQDQKVDYNVNGYINLIKKDEKNEDMAIMFFQTLTQLNDLDIRVLRLYSIDSDETIHDIAGQLNIGYDRLRIVKEKLERFGLLQSNNEKINDDNLESIIKYLQDIEKEKKKSKPRNIKLPSLKKVTRTDTYRITPLGREYLLMIQR